jgi:3-oxoadipate enol-lactonase
MGFVEWFIDLPRVRLACAVSERPGAPAIVLAHPLFMDRSMFAALAAGLAVDFTVVAYDARGHGASGPPDDGRHDMDAAYDDAVGLIEALDLAPVHFAGNSMGGFTALRLAARRPDLVRSVAAIGSSGDAEGQLAAFEPLVDHLRAHGGAEIAPTLAHVFFGDDSLASPAFEAERTRWTDRFAAMPRSMADAAAGVIYRTGILGELRHSSVPVLAVAGAQDHAYSVALSERIASTAPRGTLKVIEGAGHSVAMEKPVETEAALRAFIAPH